MERDAVKYVAKLPPESVVDLYGEVRKADIKSVTQGDCEIALRRIYGVSISVPVLPFKVPLCQYTTSILIKK